MNLSVPWFIAGAVTAVILWTVDRSRNRRAGGDCRECGD